jgi:hypothetical protein
MPAATAQAQTRAGWSAMSGYNKPLNALAHFVDARRRFFSVGISGAVIFS